MPTYDYRCGACGHEFELFQQMTEPVKRKCPACGKPKLERLIGTGAGVIFKGGGFYETDYRSDSYKKAAEAEKKAAEPSTDSKKESKTETAAAANASKPEPKPEPKSEAPSKPKRAAKRTRNKSG